jgi:tetratricopeptide (TPR) repeat protein
VQLGLVHVKAKRHLCCLLAASLCFPLLARAQSPGSSAVVSVRELSIPPKAVHDFEKGDELLAKKDAAASLPHFHRAVEKFPGYYEAYYKMGEAYLQLWRIEDAEQAFRNSIEVSGGKCGLALLALGSVLDSKGKFAEAEKVTRRGLVLEPASWSGHYYLGMALFGLDRLEDAEKEVREAIRRKADSAEALRLLADILAREKDYAALVNDLDEYLKLDPDSPSATKARAIREVAQRMVIESQDNSAVALSQH